LITKANSYFINKQYEKAIPFYSEALTVSEKDCVPEIRITIYQILGSCRRKAGYFDSWDVFVEGWRLIETLDEQQIKTQLSLRYYALEMLKSAGFTKGYEYEKRFISFWGENWQNDIKKMEKEQKQRMSTIS
jgi:hypothetical protein